MSNSKNNSIIIAGGTGFLGTALCKSLIENYTIIIVTRNKTQQLNNIQYINWDEIDNLKSYANVKAIINLSGSPVLSLWTNKNKNKIRSSRIEGTNKIVTLINVMSFKPDVLINASAIGFFEGKECSQENTELSESGTDFLADVCKSWENEAKKSEIRTVMVRIGLVLDKHNGFLSLLKIPFYFFVGGHLGNGKQACPWIHIDDVVNSISFCINNENIKGPIHLVAPEKISLKMFCKKLATILKRPSWLHVPTFLIKLFFRDFGKSLLNTPYIEQKRLIEYGFDFKYKSSTGALKSLLNIKK